MRYPVIVAVAFLVLVSVQSLADEHMHHHGSQMGMSTPLTEAGNDTFGTIQEVVINLMNDPNTDWSKVDLEALRHHLIDMRNFTANVAVLKTSPIDNGVEFTVKATTMDSHGSLQRLFRAHPAFLKQESGWNMTVVENRNKSFTAHVTTKKPQEVAMVRGLGYIGIIAYGQHHQLHHWMMARGMYPHTQ